MKRSTGILPFLLVPVLVGLALPAAAQSPFALRNVGQRTVASDARMVARGFGMTVNDSLHPGFMNTASLASLRRLAVHLTGYGEKVVSSSDAGDRRTYRTFLPEIRVGAPVIKNRLALTAGFSIRRSSRYQTSVDTTWTVWDDIITGSQVFSREGSIFHVPLGAALRILPGLSVSGNVNLVRGNLRETLTNFYFEPSGILGQPFYQPSSRVEEYEYSGTSYTVGGLWSPGSGWFRVGFSWSPSYDVDAETKLELQGVTLRGYGTSTMTVPEEWRGGLHLKLGGRWRVGGDGRFQEYSGYQGREDWEAEMVDEYGYSFGVERVRASVRRGGFNNLPFRLGASYLRWGYEVGGEPVIERSYSLGTGFPFQHEQGQLDIAVSWSSIGDRDLNGFRSEAWRLTVSVTALEKWW